MATLLLLLCLAVLATVATSSSPTEVIVSSSSGAAAIGAALCTLVVGSIVAPIVRLALGSFMVNSAPRGSGDVCVQPAEDTESNRTSDVCISSLSCTPCPSDAGTATPPTSMSSKSASPVLRPSEEDERMQEAEERLLRALGYESAEEGAWPEDDGGASFLSADEIAQFHLKAAAAVSDSPPMRYKDRTAPLSDIVSRWQGGSPTASSAGSPLSLQGARSPSLSIRIATPERQVQANQKTGKKAKGSKRQGGSRLAQPA